MKLAHHNSRHIAPIYRLVALCLLIGVALASQSSNVAYAQTNEDDIQNTSRVVIISLPRVTWKALVDADTPHMDKLIERGSLASLSIRTPQTTRTIEKGYASLATGNRALVVSSDKSTFYAPTEQVGTNDAQDVFRDQQNINSENAQAVSIGFELVHSRNSKGLFPAEIGSFASSLQDNGKSVAVFGNSDKCSDNVPMCRQRAIGYIGVNKDGIVKHGDVSSGLLNDDLTMNMKIVEDKATKSIKDNDVTAVECSDLERIEQARKKTKADLTRIHRTDALQKCDDLVGELMKSIDLENDRVFLVSPISPQSTEQLAVFVAAGKDIEPGYAVSGITRREGVVALADIAPSILSFLDIEPPSSMVTTLLDWKKSSDSSTERKQVLIDMDRRARMRDDSFVAVAAIFMLTVFLGIILSIVAYKKVAALRKIAKILALIAACMPTIAFLMLPLMLTLGSPLKIVIAFATLSCLGAGIAYILGEKFGYVRVMLGIVSINLFVQIADIVTGGNLQFNSLFGYSAIVAGRFAGFGNLAFSIVSISAVLFVALLKELSVSYPRWRTKWVNLCAMCVLVGVLIVDGAPNLGSDVGGVLAITPMIIIAGLMLYNKRITIRSFIIAGIATLGAISLFSLFDLTRPISERTHLGRFVKILLDGQAGVVIERKIVSNFDILTNSVLASVILLGSLFGLYLFTKPERFLRNSSKAHPSFPYIAYPGLVLGILGMFLNDSGVAIPGMMIAIAYPVIALLTFEKPPQITASQYDTTLTKESV